MRCKRFLLAGMLGCLPAFAAGTAPAPVRPFAAWSVPAGFVEIRHDNPLERIYAFGSDASGPAASPEWTERARIVHARLAPSQSLADWFAVLRNRARQDCPSLESRSGPSRGDGTEQVMLEMWHCPREAGSGRGFVALYKMIAVGGQVFLLVTEARYPPFAPGKTPLTRAQLARWTAFENGFVLCEGHVLPACMGDADALDNAPAAAMTPAERSDARRAEMLGRELAAQERLSLAAGKALGDRRMQADGGVRGWIAVPSGNAAGKVYFFRGTRDKPELAWVVSLSPGTPPAVEKGQARQLTDDLVMRFRARQTAMLEQTKPCTPALDTAVARDPKTGLWQAYTLALSGDEDRVWMGGGTRYTLTPDAVTIIRAHRSAKGCLSTPLHDAAGRAITELLFGDPLTDVPDEFAVMRQLQTGLPMIVGTPAAVWSIRDGRIRKLAPKATQRMTLAP